MTPENVPRIVIGFDKANSNDYSAEVRGYWLNGCLHIVSIKTLKNPPRTDRGWPSSKPGDGQDN